jgi:hypothetical protein
MRTSARWAIRALAGITLFTALAAHACGFCLEDKVAAVYDQALVDAARARGRSVVFFAIEGSPRLEEATRRAVLAALVRPGTTRATARVSLESAAGSVAYDPGRTDPAKLAASADRALAPLALTLTPLRVIDAAGKLSELEAPGGN